MFPARKLPLNFILFLVHLCPPHVLAALDILFSILREHLAIAGDRVTGHKPLSLHLARSRSSDYSREDLAGFCITEGIYVLTVTQGYP